MASIINTLVNRPIGPSLFFLVVNAVALLLILHANRRQKPTLTQEWARPVLDASPKSSLGTTEALGWEFGYAATTSSEAMAERHSVVNIYLVAAGIVISGVVALFGGEGPLRPAAGTVLLWLLCGVGWNYFLAVIRLRQAWVESGKTMNQIKDFVARHAKKFTPDEMRTAFRWQTGTLPQPHKPWTVYFYSAMLIALLNSGAYVVGGLLLAPQAPYEFEWYHLALLSLLGLAFFGYHVWLYFSFLQD